jgi:NAD(P)H-dependent flavin oxidoreductase YrpB (nitropropane dioxygenase family)
MAKNGATQETIGDDRRTAGGRLPRIIQGGMGVGVSSWELAGTVAAEGQLGVVSGTTLELVYARRLQLGDPGGHARRAFAAFPLREIADRVLAAYFIDGGKAADAPFRVVPMYSLNAAPALKELTVVANFAEVHLAKERGRGGLVGINYLHKIQLPLLEAMYGAMLAGVDFVLMGAGNPAGIPPLLTRLARHEDCAQDIKVLYAPAGERHQAQLSPLALMRGVTVPLRRPRFLAIVASVDLATALASDPVEPPDGFVVEVATAGGHNAPPRGPLRLDERGEPIYGPLDDVDLSGMARLGLPFWMGGSYGRPEALRAALAGGAQGIQVGTAFAFCRESGLAPALREQVLRAVIAGQVRVRTDPRASPTGFPFKVAQIPGSIADARVYAARQRICDVGVLRVPFVNELGRIGYRCPSEPEAIFVKKRGLPGSTAGRACLCNGLLATIGLPQTRRDGSVEPPLLTSGDDLPGIARFLPPGATSYGAADVIHALLGQRPVAASHHGPGASPPDYDRRAGSPSAPPA